MPADMKLVELGPRDIRRVHPCDMEQFMAMHPGAKLLDGDEETMAGAGDVAEEPEAKAKSGPPANKSRAKAEDK